MSLRHGVLSFLVFLFVLLLGLKNYEIWTLPIEIVPEKEATKKTGTKIESPPVMGGQKEPTPIASYIFVAEKNIFNPDRKDFPIVAPPAGSPGSEVKKPIVRPQIILYGVTIVGEYESASVANPGRPIKRGERELVTLRIGDRIGEYKLAKILSDRITMESTEDTFEVLLYDPRVPKQRTYVKTETKPAAITTTLPPPPAEVAVGPRPPTPQPSGPIREGVITAPMPRPVTPAPIPAPRTRRW
jgi:hypothetical protein